MSWSTSANLYTVGLGQQIIFQIWKSFLRKGLINIVKSPYTHHEFAWNICLLANSPEHETHVTIPRGEWILTETFVSLL